MSVALDLIASASVGAVEVAGIKWRIRAIRSDMVRGIRYHILHVRLPTEEDLVEEAAIATRPEAEQAQAKAEIAARKTRAALTPENMATNAEKDEDIVCAGVDAVWANGEWSPVRVTAAGTVADPNASPPSLPVDSLPPSVVAALSHAVWDLSTDGGDAADRLRSFLRGP